MKTRTFELTIISHDPQRAERNAKLWDAAPELLAALKAFLAKAERDQFRADGEDYTEEIRQARAAIRKIVGG